MTAFTAHLDSWRSGGEIKQTMLLKAWCPGADVLMDEAVAFKHYLFDFFDDNLDMLVALRLRMGVQRATECARTAFAYFDHRAECQARYTADFHNQLARPCPACGKPQEVNDGYACACQGPELPRVPQNTANQNAKEDDANGDSTEPAPQQECADRLSAGVYQEASTLPQEACSKCCTASGCFTEHAARAKQGPWHWRTEEEEVQRN
jgi:hypothetical protein